jgi:hypothetical protein
MTMDSRRKSLYEILSTELQLRKICFSAIQFQIAYVPDYVKIAESFLWWNEKTDWPIDYKNIPFPFLKIIEDET